MDVINLKTKARDEFVDITKEVQAVVTKRGLTDGAVQIFCPHTTGAITVNENWDPDVQSDMNLILERIVPWEGGYRHGEGNSAAHLKASLFGSSAQVIVEEGKLVLGQWQGIYFCEFDGPRSRRALVKLLRGED